MWVHEMMSDDKCSSDGIMTKVKSKELPVAAELLRAREIDGKCSRLALAALHVSEGDTA